MTEKVIKVQSARFGEFTISEDQVVTFPLGLPGFKGIERWCLLHLEDVPTLSWLQAIDDADISLLIADPDELVVNYEVQLEAEVLAPIGVTAETTEPPVVMRVLLKLDQEAGHFAANLAAPLLFNVDSRQAMQIILHGSGYSMSHPVNIAPLLVPSIEEDVRVDARAPVRAIAMSADGPEGEAKAPGEVKVMPAIAESVRDALLRVEAGR